MTLQLELWHAILLAVSFVGGVAGAGRFVFAQIDRRLDQQFGGISESLSLHAAEAGKSREQLMSLERDFLRFQAELPLQYVRREDFVRNQTVIEAKLDGLAMRVENVLLKGARHD